MYNKILILLIFVSLILLLNYCSTILQEPTNLNNKRNIENLPNPQKKIKRLDLILMKMKIMKIKIL